MRTRKVHRTTGWAGIGSRMRWIVLGLGAAIAGLVIPSFAYAQGSIFGTVQNSNLNNPAVGDLFWFGFLDDTDEEIRIELNTGAGYDGTNWFDDFQNYTTEAAGNPFDHYFVNVAIGEGYHLSGAIPSGSFFQRNILLASGTFPSRPSALIARVASNGVINVSWTYQSGVTYHVYRRATSNNGVFKRIDDPTGNLANAGVSDSFFVDINSDGTSNYTYVIIGEDASGNYSAHSAEFAIDASVVLAPTLTNVEPDSGSSTGMPGVTVKGTNFDVNGATVTFGGVAATNVTVVSPFEITCNVPSGTPGAFVDVELTNTASGLTSATLVDGFRYLGNTAPVLISIGAQSVDEGQNLNFGVSATDPDGDTLILSAVNVPANATFSDSFDGTGTFDFNPDFSQSGVYNVTFIASDGVLADTEVVAITVNDVSLTPVLSAIGPQSVDEGQNLNFGVSASDPDGDSLILSAESIPSNATFNDNFDGTGTFDFNPDFTQANVYNVRFIASDGTLADTEIVAITVNDINRAPILATIGAQSVDEGQNLNLGVSASDPEVDSVILSAANIPTNATFTDNFDGTGTFDFDPDYSQSGVANVTIIASDGLLADTEIVAITINDVNLTPNLAGIGPQSVDEGQNLNFGISATDVDGDSLILSAENVPANATFNDNFDGTGTFDFNPDFTQSGVINVTFIASDGVLADTEIVAITVNQINQPPVLAAIGPQFVNEGQNLNLPISASDLDNDSLVITAENIPANATFNDNFDGTATFDFNPSFVQAGLYNITFIVTDGVLADTEVVAITVNDAGNQPPVLAAIGPQNVIEGQNLNFGISAGDADGDSIILSAENLPANATFSDNFDGTGSFDFNPDFTQAGSYNVTFIASDGSLADTEIVAVTVFDGGNQRPVLVGVSPQSVDEGQNLNFGVSATDVDLDSLILTAVGLPANATFNDHFDGTGTFDFNPDFTQSGVYNVSFIASDGALADTETVAITVNHINLAPTLDPIGPQAVDEGQNLNVVITTSDPDLDSLILSAENLPANATFTDNFDGTGTFDFNPDFAQAGLFNVRFIVSDGALADTELVSVTVNDIKLAPQLTSIGPKNVTEGQNLNVVVSATDFDGDSLVLSAENLPINATFVDNFNGTGVFDFNPSFIQAGPYNVTFIVSDGVLADTEMVAVTVIEAGNQRPVLSPIGPQVVIEGQNLLLNLTATDADSTTPTMIAQSVPANASFQDNSNGTATFSFTPSFTQAGLYNVVFIATDGSLADTEFVAITVLESGNQRPVVDAIPPQSVDEGQTLVLLITASDPENQPLTLTARNMPANAAFVDSGSGVGSFTFSPNYAQAAVYNVRFIANDGALADTETVAITVNHVNLPPVLASVGAQFVDEGQNLSVIVSASDFDADSLILTAENLPLNATFDDNFDGTGTFGFNPDSTQAGVYNVRFIVSDGALSDTEMVAVTVNQVNLAPVLATIGGQVVSEGQNLNFGVSSSDFDGDSLSLSAENLPANATFNDNFDGTGVFDFNPDFTQAGPHNVTFIVSDGALADTEIVTITVNDAGNQAPTLAAIGPQTVTEGLNLNFGINGSDPDGDSVILSAENLPANATFNDNFDGTGTFDFNPDFTQAGLFNVTFIVSDGVLADTEVVAITVNDAGNQAPVWTPISAQLVTEGLNLNFVVSATDVDLDSLVMTAENVPANASFNDNFDGTGTFDFNPDFVQAGVYNVDFIVSDGALADTQTVQITVNDAGNQAPIWTAIGPQSVDENQNLNVGVSASDADGDSLILTAENLPANATFSDHLDGTGTFDFNPDFSQAGLFNVTFIVSDGALADTEIVAVTVNDVNQPPTLNPIGSQLVDEGLNLNVPVSAVDLDGDSVILSAENLPANATFTDNIDGTGVFDFNPDFTQSGLYNVTFIASDGALADTEIVAVTVNEGGNQRPLLTAINDTTIGENTLLTIGVNATEPDSDSLILTAENLPPNASFVDNFDGTGQFDFAPNFFQAGLYSVTFIASDGLLADTEVVAITVSNVNQVPVLNPIGPLSVLEGDTLLVVVTASDADSVIPSLAADSLPSGAVFTDSANGVASLFYVPTFDQAGVYQLIITAFDGADADTEVVTLTVNDAGNQPPVLSTIGALSVQEGDTLRVRITASDPDSTTPALTVVNLPPNATFTDSLNGAAGFVLSTNYGDGGNAYLVTFVASDGIVADSEFVLITIDDLGNLSPVFDSIGSKVVKEGDSLKVLLHAVDPEGGTVTIGRLSNIENASFVDSGNGYGLYQYKPNYYQAGVDTARFLAIDNGTPPASRLLLIPITTTEVNVAPIQNPIGNRTVLAGDSLKIRVVATDSTAPPGNQLTMVMLNPPLNATYQDSGNGIGKFKFKPTFQQLGSYQITFLAVDNGTPSLVAQEIVTITVLSQNRAPVLATIGPKSVVEGGFLQFNVYATDPDSTTPFLSVDTLPANAIFVDSGNGTGTFTFSPTFLQGGLYQIKFTASDGLKSDNETVLIQVQEAGNQNPTFDPYPDTVTVLEKSRLLMQLTASDPEFQALSFSIDALLPNAIFTDSGDGRAYFDITPDYWQDSTYDLQFFVEDIHGFSDTALIVLEIADIGNQLPIFDPIDTQFVLEQDALVFNVVASDSDLTVPSLTARPLPPHSSIQDMGDGTIEFTIVPLFNDDAVYDVYFVATDAEDSGLKDSILVPVVVLDRNRPPQFTSSSTNGIAVLMAQGDTSTIWYRATDPDGPIPEMSAINLPSTNMTWADSGNGYIYFTFAPAFNEIGSFVVTFAATDSVYDTTQTTILQTFSVGFTNVPPELTPIGQQTVTENDTLEFLVTATDANGQIPAVNAENLPTNATFMALGGGEGRFTFAPSFVQAGNYQVRFIARDASTADTMLVDIAVLEAGNQAPYWSTVLPTDTVILTIARADTIQMSAVDIDNSTLSLTADSVPSNAMFSDNGNKTATFTFNPDSTQIDSSYTIVFIAADTSLADTAWITYRILPFTRGDLNDDGTFDVFDVVILAGVAFRNEPEPIPKDKGDINSDGIINVIDMVMLVEHVFRGGPPLPP